MKVHQLFFPLISFWATFRTFFVVPDEGQRASTGISLQNLLFGKNQIFIVVIFFVAGCKNFSEQKAENGEGIITYKISYSGDNPYKNYRFLPSETILYFKGTKATFATSGIGIIQVVNLLDNEHKKFTSLLINSLGENFAFTEVLEDITYQENNPKYTFEMTSEKKMIAGLECNKVVVNDLTTPKKFNIFCYKKIKTILGNSAYKDFNYLLMEYQDTRYGLPMQLLATKVVFSPVDTTLFKVEGHGEYNWVDRKTFLSVINHL